MKTRLRSASARVDISQVVRKSFVQADLPAADAGEPGTPVRETAASGQACASGPRLQATASTEHGCQTPEASPSRDRNSGGPREASTTAKKRKSASSAPRTPKRSLLAQKLAVTVKLDASVVDVEKERPAKKPKPLPPARPTTPELLAKAERIRGQLQELYPNPPIPLDHSTPYQLLVAVMLSAQSTDKMVNEITPALFARAPDAAAMARMQPSEVAELIQKIGLAPTKSKNLVNMSRLLVERHGGQVPSTFEELEDLPGVGHKTASVVMSQCHGQPAFPVDTHIHRLAQRWGLTCGKNVEQTEADLKSVFPMDSWNVLHLQLIFFGREHCSAKLHDPGACQVCSWAAVAPYNRPGVSPVKAGQKAAVISASVSVKRKLAKVTVQTT